jgi:predicted phosphodiesterase
LRKKKILNSHFFPSSGAVMRYAVLSDIHGNLEALRAVLEAVAALGADRLLCCGDIVGYNADPKACVAIVRAEGIESVLGNHDAAACGLTRPDRFTARARRAALWTLDRLDDEERGYLRSLPPERGLGGIFLCHGSVHDTDRYVLTFGDAKDAFRDLAAIPGSPALCFFGHTHVPMAFRMARGKVAVERRERFPIESRSRYLVNPGSVGQPRDGDPRASFLIYDDEERTATVHRVAYDIAACRDKIIRAGLPPELAERLELGR